MVSVWTSHPIPHPLHGLYKCHLLQKSSSMMSDGVWLSPARFLAKTRTSALRGCVVPLILHMNASGAFTSVRTPHWSAAGRTSTRYDVTRGGTQESLYCALQPVLLVLSVAVAETFKGGPGSTETKVQHNVQPFHSRVQKRTLSQLHMEKCISEEVRIGSIITFHLSKLWKAKFFILCDVIFLVRMQEKCEIDHRWEWKG